MEKRRHQSVADYAAIALCPSLIVLLISSLVYFLVMCVYRGGYSGRIGYIWFMFIVGAVGIARLSIQESRKYALGYGAVLGGATLLVLSQFMTVQGPLAGLTLIINGATIALVWFLADRITFDCTVIDEDEDASGQGLLGGGILDGLTNEANSAGDADQHKTRRRGRQPGRTVLWLTAAALPIFGLGQIMLPQDERWHQSAIFALAIYLFAALSLLVATSFLGVRRYLRQRGVDMPADVSTAWLAGGVTMTAIMLLACFLLPQPGKMLANVELPQSLESPDWLKPSKYGWGSESAKPEEGASSSASAPPQSPEQEPGDTGGEQSQSEKSSGEAGGQQQGNRGEGGEKSGGDQKSDGSDDRGNQSPSQSDNPSDGKDESKSGDASKQDTGNQDAGKQDASKQDASSQDAKKNSSQEKSEASKSSEENRSSESQSDDRPSDSQSQSSPEPQSPPSSFADQMPSLGNLLKAIVYFVLIGILVAFAWIQRHEIAKAWQAFLAWLRGESATTSEADESIAQEITTKPSLPFSAFRNPLGKSGDPREAVIVTYQAAEAWWREHGQARKPDETPFEFMRRLKPSNAADQEAMMRLTEAYNRVVYGDDAVGPPDLAAAAAVWKSFAR